MDANYESLTPEKLKAEMLAALDRSVETREGSYANTLLSPAAYQMYRIYQLMPQILLMAFPDSSAGEYIDKRAADFGIFRVQGKRAAVVLRFTAFSGTVLPSIPAGTVACTEDGLRFVTLADAVFHGLTAEVPAQAEAIGRIYNVDANTITVMAVNKGGLKSVTNPEEAVGGTDDETDEALLQRWHEHLRRPITSGNANHYIEWAKEIDGVTNVAVQPLWRGPGTVKVVIAGPDKDPVDGTVVAACAAHIEAERPIGAEVTVVSVQTVRVDVTAAVTLTSGSTIQAVETELSAALGRLLASMPYGQENLLRYSRGLALLLGCDGVEEYHTCTLNGGTENLTFAPEQTPVVGTVTVSEGG